MKYLLMVGHGQFPPGLHNALTMFASDTPDLLYCNLENGMDTDKYVENLKKKLEVIDPQKDEIIILSDLPGGFSIDECDCCFRGYGNIRTLCDLHRNEPSISDQRSYDKRFDNTG